MKTTMRCGDIVHHVPLDEDWTVAWAEYEDMAWTGWPNGIARIADCEIVYSCTDQEHVEAVKQWIGVDDLRTGRVMKLYGHVLAGDELK